MNDEWAGYVEQDVRDAIGKYEEGLESFSKALYAGLQSDFVEPMSQNWASTQAQKFFTGPYKTSIEELYKSVEESLASVTAALNSAADKLARAGEDTWTEIAHTPTKNPMDVSVVKENLNGKRGVALASTTSTLEHLATIHSSTSQTLDGLTNALSNSGFKDAAGEQQAAINRSMSDIKNDVLDFVNSINTSIKSYLDETVRLYGDLVSSNVESFTDK